MPEEDKNSNDTPTWADFKPPVLTTPYGATSGSNDNSDVSSRGVVPTPTPANPEITPPEAWVQPVVTEPVETSYVSGPAIPQTPSQPEAALPAPPPPSPEPQIIPESATTADKFIQPSSRHDESFIPPALPAVSEDSTPVSSEPEVATEPPVQSVPTLPQVSSVPATPAIPAVPATQNSSKKMLIAVTLGVILTAAAGAGYYFWNSSPSEPPPTSSTPGENTAILADSQSASSWENNYSTSLLASERGGLEFLATDPPATESASPQSAPLEMTSLKVKIAKVDLHLATQSVVASGVSPEATKSANKEVDRWETLRLNQNTTVDLVDLRNKGGALSSLGITYLAAGHYTEIRLFITQATGVTKDGTSVNIEIPGKTGIIKLVKSFDVSTTGVLKLIVDFDAPSMVVKAGETYQLKPVVAKVIYNDQEI